MLERSQNLLRNPATLIRPFGAVFFTQNAHVCKIGSHYAISGIRSATGPLPSGLRAGESGAELAFEYYQQREALTVDHKGDDLQDVVSVADKRVEAFVKQRIQSAFPEDGFLGEESGARLPDARVLWVVDPIDGTSCFLNGLHTWCLSLAIVADGEPVIGVVYDPNHRELFHALRGHGAWLNDAPIRPHPATTVKEGVMGVGTSHRVTPADFLPFLQALLSDGGMFIRNGSGALMSAWAAAGRLIGYYEPHMNPWDALPGLVLMREAGGASNDFLAQEGIQRGNPLLLASQTLYPQLKKMISQPLH